MKVIIAKITKIVNAILCSNPCCCNVTGCAVILAHTRALRDII